MPRAPERLVNMTPAQQHAQDATVRVLRQFADAAEAHLRGREARLDDRSTTRICPCGNYLSDCMCPLWRGKEL
jgi:hypothetical protein